jgi:hypothetical protein
VGSLMVKSLGCGVRSVPLVLPVESDSQERGDKVPCASFPGVVQGKDCGFRVMPRLRVI